MPRAPPAAASAGARTVCRPVQADAQQIQAIPEDEPLHINSLAPTRAVQGAVRRVARDAVAQNAPRDGGSGTAAASAVVAEADRAGGGKLLEGATAPDGSVPLDEESGGLLVPWLKPLRWPKMPHLGFYSDIGSGTWWDVFFAISVVMSSPGAMAPLPYAIARLTWPGGLVMITAFWCCAYYTALLLAELHQWRPTMRFCRYRDLSRSIWGMKGFHSIFVLQQLASISNNVAAQVECALVIKDLFETFHDDSQHLTVFEGIIMFACIQLFLCQIPTIRGMRSLNILGLCIAVAFVAFVTAGCLYDGKKLDRSTIDHSVPKGEKTDVVVFKVFEAFGILAFSFTNPLLPEIQSITKPPAVQNGKKGVSAAFFMALWMYPLLAVSAFWAFGTGVPEIVTIGEFPDTSYMVVIAAILLVIHSAINFQIYARLTLEVIDYLLQDPLDGNLLSPKNMLARFSGSAVYILTVSFISSIMPVHLDDITVVVGCLGSITLTLILPPLMYNSVRKPGRLRRWAHILMAVFWSIILIATAAGAVYNIVVETKFRGPGFYKDVNIIQQIGLDRLVPVCTVLGALYSLVEDMRVRGSGFFRNVNVMQQLGIEDPNSLA